MDEVWQQNKKWILGVFAGLLLFWIATSIVHSVYDGESAENGARKMARASGEFYDQTALRAARRASDGLEAVQVRLIAELEADLDVRFDLDGKGDPDLHFDRVARSVRSQLVDKSQAYAVDMRGDSLEWSSPVGREEIQRTLRGLGVLEQAVLRLLEAGDEVRGADPDAVGLQSIDKFEIQKKSRRQRPSRRGIRRGRRGRAKQIDASSRVAEYAVKFKFKGDAATLQLFLEKCRGEVPILLVQEGLKLKKSGRERGDVAQVTGQVVGLSVQVDE